ncbi:MAG: asparaginase domain-containing protein [Candidatus Competibacteraceae bacterium]
MQKRIFIAYTGGTIGMRRTPQGYVPESGLDRLLAHMIPPDLAEDMPDYVLHECSHLIDSANLHPRDWYRIADLIASHYHDYDGFVVLHGTDTMAYTASGLSFALPGLTKPVIVTGSQIPLREMRNDARNNLLTALLAAKDPIPEVCLYFNGRLMRGNRATKLKGEALDAFDSPNYPLLAKGRYQYRDQPLRYSGPNRRRGVRNPSTRRWTGRGAESIPRTFGQTARQGARTTLAGLDPRILRHRRRTDRVSRFSGDTGGGDRARRHDH